MEHETKLQKDYLLQASILISAVILARAWVYTTVEPPQTRREGGCGV